MSERVTSCPDCGNELIPSWEYSSLYTMCCSKCMKWFKFYSSNGVFIGEENKLHTSGSYKPMSHYDPNFIKSLHK